MKIAIITICVYSLILAVVSIYKDESSHSFGIEPIDIVVGGPVTWLLFALIFCIYNPIYKKYSAYRKKHPKSATPYRPYTPKQISKIVEKAMKASRKSCEYYRADYRDFVFTFDKEFVHKMDCDEIYDLRDLPYQVSQYKKLTKKYNQILLHQREELITAILPYFEPWTVEEYNKLEFSPYWIKTYKDTPLWRLKEC